MWLILFCTSVLVSWPCEGSAAVPPLSDGPETWTTCFSKPRTPEVSETTPEKTTTTNHNFKKSPGNFQGKRGIQIKTLLKGKLLSFLASPGKESRLKKTITLADESTTNLDNVRRTKYCRYLRYGAQLKVCFRYVVKFRQTKLANSHGCI